MKAAITVAWAVVYGVAMAFALPGLLCIHIASVVGDLADDLEEATR